MSKQQQKSKSTRDSSDDSASISPQRKKMLIAFVMWILYNAIRVSLLLCLFITLPSLIPSPFSSEAYLHMQQVISLWNQNMIINIRIQKEQLCGEGWQDVWGAWPGNVQGCSCAIDANAYTYELVFIGKCTAQEISADCKIVNANNAVPYKYWGKDQHICIQRIQGLNFYSTQSNIITSLNFTHCPSSNPPPDYLVDFVETMPCPINALSNNLSFSEPIGGGWSIDRGNGWPMAGVRIVIGDVCSWLYQEEADAGLGQDYVLMAGNRKECKVGDWRSTSISHMDELSLFTANPPILQIVNNLPASPPASHRQSTTLLFYSYPPWSYDCRMSPQFNLINARSNFQFTPLMGSIMKYIVICGGVLAGLCLLVIWEICSRLGAWKIGQHAREWIQLRERKRLYPYLQKPDIAGQIIKFGIYMLLCVTCLITLSLFHGYLAAVYAWYLDSYGCTNASLALWIASYLEEMASRMKFAMGMIGGIIAIAVVQVMYWIWRRNRGDLKEEDDQRQQNIMRHQMKNRQMEDKIQQNQSSSNITDQKHIFSLQSCIQQTQEILMEGQMHLQSSMMTAIPVTNQRRPPMIMTDLISDTISQMSH